MELTKSEKDQINLPVYASQEAELGGDLESIIEAFESFAKEVGTDVSEVRVSVEKEYGYYDEISFSTSLYVHRPPTEDEKQVRLDRILKARQQEATRKAKARKAKAEQERKDYERLKKKFERGSIRAAE